MIKHSITFNTPDFLTGAEHRLLSIALLGVVGGRDSVTFVSEVVDDEVEK